MAFPRHLLAKSLGDSAGEQTYAHTTHYTTHAWGYTEQEEQRRLAQGLETHQIGRTSGQAANLSTRFPMYTSQTRVGGVRRSKNPTTNVDERHPLEC